MSKYVVFDTETGGLNAKENSLLTAYFGIYDAEFKLIDELYLYLKPDNGSYNVTKGALAVNKINLVEHDEKATRTSDAASILANFLRKNRSQSPLIPVAHNIKFDLDFLHEQLLPKKAWEKNVSYRNMDTATVARFLIDSGILPAGQLASMGKLAEYFNVYEDLGVAESELHDAKADCMLTIEVYQRMQALVKPLDGG